LSSKSKSFHLKKRKYKPPLFEQNKKIYDRLSGKIFDIDYAFPNRAEETKKLIKKKYE